MRNIISPTFKTSSFNLLLLSLCLFLLFIGIDAIGFGCSNGNEMRGNSKISEMIIGETERGNSFNILQGSIVSIRLEENPTTGYEWEISEIDSRVVELQDSEYIGASGNFLGAGGVRIFTFEAKSLGITPISLKLLREWEQEEAAIENFEVTVRVIKAQ